MKQIKIVVLSAFIFSACNQPAKNRSHQAVSDENIREGKKLAAQYCGSCHQEPVPSLLDSKTWENGVLPAMGPHLGIFFYGYRAYPSHEHDPNIGRTYYPGQQLISFIQWQQIMDYYTALAPDTLMPAKQQLPIELNDKLFAPVNLPFSYKMPATSFVKFDSGKGLIACDAVLEKMFVFNNRLQLADSIDLPGPVTDVKHNDIGYVICNTGILSPNNGKPGSLAAISASNKRNNINFFDSLMRPVYMNEADLNKDGRIDIVVCEFGNLKGKLSWLENKGNGQYGYHVIRAMPGAVATYVNDYNNDGLPDIWALFAQAEEGVFLFTNKGNADFETKRILQFPPSYGSSSFELDDFNKDGFPDILYTCGDNADYSPVLKPYHGVYIYLNDGNNRYTQKFFYSINGCYKALARDYDNDGDIDIATIAFFADYQNRPEEGFVYLRNDGGFNFKPYSIAAAKYGRWLTMDAGDLNGDGRIDLVLGNFSVVPSLSKSKIDWTSQPPFLVLGNIQ